MTLADVTAPAWADVEGVLLDADDTLYDTRSAMHRAGARAAASLWPDADPERVARAGIRFRDDPEGHFAAYTRGELEFAEMRRARVAELATWLEQEVDDGLWDAFEAAYEPAFLGALDAFPDVRPALGAWGSAGVRVGILTNSSSAYTALKLEASGLADLFDVVCSTDTLGFGKPDPRAFHEACRRLGTDPARTGYVGDEARTDPLGAHDAGMPTAWLVRETEPTATVPGPAAGTDGTEATEVLARGIPVVRTLAEVVALRDLGRGLGAG
ncbi:HAD family hydrolase [Oryzobacter terrae]|uniref:HAD family hydrolase n=1 Tax=Oryzobacter terrae TaxID=1620385 RepID=UPI00366FD64E